jgi:ATP/maltotriose-dependent transcriptional regulator MalT
MPLQTECGRTLLEAQRFDDLADWLAHLPGPIRRSGRMKLLSAWAAYHRDELDAAEALLGQVRLDDIREGETTLSDLWFAIQAKRAAAAEGIPLDDALRQRIRQSLQPPAHLDFRMH